MLKYTLIPAISFCLEFLYRNVNKNKSTKKIQPLSKQNFRKAMKELEIK